MKKLLFTLFGWCSHARLGIPVTAVEKTSGRRGQTTVYCQDCNTKVEYDWDKMRIGRSNDVGNVSGITSDTDRLPGSGGEMLQERT